MTVKNEPMTITLTLSPALTMGGKPYNQVTALYHFALSGGDMSVEEYALEWGWSKLETEIFFQNQNLYATATTTAESNWHKSCKLINSSIHGIPVYDSGNTVVVGIHENLILKNENDFSLVFDDTSIAVTSDTDKGLLFKVKNNEQAMQLLEYWLLKCKENGFEPSKLLAKDLSVAFALVMGGDGAGAMMVIDWVFSDHHRAKWLRNQNPPLIRLANIAHKGVFSRNKAFAEDMSTMSAVKNNNTKKQQSRSFDDAMFDELGNYIGE